MITVTLGDVALNMGDKSFTAYQNDDTPASLDLSYFNIGRTWLVDGGINFAAPGDVFPGTPGTHLSLTHDGVKLTTYGTLNLADVSPLTFDECLVDSFQLRDQNDDSLILSVDFSTALDMKNLVNAAGEDAVAAAALVDDYVALLAGQSLNITDGGLGNRINGGAAADTISGAGGGDRLGGLKGNDKLNGGAGSDHLDGGAGNDTLNGGNSNDWITGGAGKDELTGGDGSDTFYFRLPLIRSANADTIKDFVAGVDEIVFDDMPLVIGSLSLSGFRAANGISAAGGAQTADQHFLYDKDSGRLYYDADGNDAAHHPVLVATLTTKPALSAADITLVS